MKISITGRIAVALRGIERYIERYNLNINGCLDGLLKVFWRITAEHEDISIWYEEAVAALEQVKKSSGHDRPLGSMLDDSIMILCNYLNTSITRKINQESALLLIGILDQLEAGGIRLGDISKLRSFAPAWGLGDRLLYRPDRYIGRSFSREEAMSIIPYTVDFIEAPGDGRS